MKSIRLCNHPPVGSVRCRPDAGKALRMWQVASRTWRTSGTADLDLVRHAREEVLEFVCRECPRVDTAAAALIVTELVTNVAVHAYPGGMPGRFEVDVECGDIAAAVTVRDWGRG